MIVRGLLGGVLQNLAGYVQPTASFDYGSALPTTHFILFLRPVVHVARR